MIALKEQYRVGFSRLCELGDVSYSTFKAWHCRHRAGLPVVALPGPKKVESIDLVALKGEIIDLSHGPKRTAGTVDLHERHSDAISRREFRDLVLDVRSELRIQEEENMRRITWLKSNMVWAMDDTELTGPDWAMRPRRTYLHNVRDMRSSYMFEPAAGDFACGQEVAGNLDRLCTENPPPLFLKRDNHGNLNHDEVREVMEKHFIIPLNSPCYYPQYNGAMENGQGKIKLALEERVKACFTWPDQHLQEYAAAAAHDLNHHPRPRLEGKNACNVFFPTEERVTFNRRQRKEIFDTIKHTSARILESMDAKPNNAQAQQATWRIAAEHWLKGRGYITITRGRRGTASEAINKEPSVTRLNEKKGQ
jgi:hypothetical protein